MIITHSVKALKDMSLSGKSITRMAFLITIHPNPSITLPTVSHTRTPASIKKLSKNNCHTNKIHIFQEPLNKAVLIAIFKNKYTKTYHPGS